MRRPLRVCMVHYSDYHLDSRIQRQARALADRGDEVHLVCLSRPGSQQVGLGSIHLHHVPCEKPVGGAGAYVRGYGRFLAHAMRHVTALALRGGLDLVEADNMPDILTAAALVPRLRGTPVILDVHDTFPELFATKFGYPQTHRLVRVLELEERLSAALADHVITVTEEARERLESRGVGVGRSSVVMNSPDERVFGAARQPLDVPAAGAVRVLYHGGLAPRFGVETAIRAVALLGDDLPRVELRVCGSGEDRDALAALAAELAPGRVDVAPRPVPFEHIPQELEAAHIGVVPTLHDEFTELLLPVKLLEYVHMGLPTVSSRLPGIRRYFDDSSVRFFEPGSPQSLADALRDVCRDPAGARERALAATRRLAPIGWEQQKAQYLELIDTLAARTPKKVLRKSRAARTVTSTAAP
jgi:glycosyltransferase involved in cell wall biosynthesis